MSRSYRKYPIRWVCCYSSKKDKIAYNRCFRRKDRLILKDYDDNTVLQKHKRDGLSWWDCYHHAYRQRFDGQEGWRNSQGKRSCRHVGVQDIGNQYLNSKTANCKFANRKLQICKS